MLTFNKFRHFRFSACFFPDNIPVLKRYLVVFERFPVFFLLARCSNLSPLSCSLLMNDPQKQQNKRGNTIRLQPVIFTV